MKRMIDGWMASIWWGSRIKNLGMVPNWWFWPAKAYPPNIGKVYNLLRGVGIKPSTTCKVVMSGN